MKLRKSIHELASGTLCIHYEDMNKAVIIEWKGNHPHKHPVVTVIEDMVLEAIILQEREANKNT